MKCQPYFLKKKKKKKHTVDLLTANIAERVLEIKEGIILK